MNQQLLISMGIRRPSVIISYLLLVAGTYGALHDNGASHVTMATSEMETAGSTCQANDSAMAPPLNETMNDYLTKYLKANRISAALIDLQIVTSFWHRANETFPIFDQGCYNFADIDELLDPNNFRRHAMFSDCVASCHGLSRFVAIQSCHPSSASIECICVAHVPIHNRVSESLCQEIGNHPLLKCGTIGRKTVRLLAADAVPDDNSTWGEGNHSGLCAAQGMNNALLTMRTWNCSEDLFFMCNNIKNTNQNIDSDAGNQTTWFRAYMICKNSSGRFMARGNGWSDLIAWKWTNTDYEELEIVYTNWAPGHPDLTLGACISVWGNDGLWRTTNCSSLTNVVCYGDVDENSTASVVQPTHESDSQDASHQKDSSHIIELTVGSFCGVGIGITAWIIVYKLRQRSINLKKPLETHDLVSVEVPPEEINLITGGSYEAIPAFTNASRNIGGATGFTVPQINAGNRISFSYDQIPADTNAENTNIMFHDEQSMDDDSNVEAFETYSDEQFSAPGTVLLRRRPPRIPITRSVSCPTNIRQMSMPLINAAWKTAKKPGVTRDCDLVSHPPDQPLYAIPDKKRGKLQTAHHRDRVSDGDGEGVYPTLPRRTAFDTSL